MHIVERFNRFLLETLEVEERHCGVEHFDIFLLEQLLPDFKRVVLLHLWLFEVHSSKEQTGNADSGKHKCFFKEVERHRGEIIV